ncbi:MAG: hypothetical protein ACLUEK_13540 [Oscillospiraceae bacterium]
MLIKLISPLVAVLVFIVLPLWLIARRAKAGKSVKKPLIANLCGFFLVMFATAVVFLGQGVAAANDAAEAAAVAGSTDWTKAIGYLAARRQYRLRLGHRHLELTAPPSALTREGAASAIHSLRRHRRRHRHLRPAMPSSSLFVRCFCHGRLRRATSMRRAGARPCASKKDMDATASRVCAVSGIAISSSRRATARSGGAAG